MKQSIIITSIFQPTDAVKAFAKLEDYDLIVVGDKKTPGNWKYKDITFLSVHEQSDLPFQLAKVLPYNHYSRKMLGYLLAIQEKSDFIIDTDDDNIPYENWDFPSFFDEYDLVDGDNGFINIYQWFSEQKIWPRGFPLALINTKYNFNGLISKELCNVGIWQGLADEDPDVDAMYRLTCDMPCIFDKKDPIVLSKGTICPFNTQNTKITKELFPLLYLPTYVTFRFTDILRGLIAQPIMWLYNYQLGFINANVVQKRNPHNYMKDFVSEIPMYKHCTDIPEIVGSAISGNKYISENLYLAYQELLKERIVTDKELVVLEAWLNDIETLGVNKIETNYSASDIRPIG